MLEYLLLVLTLLLLMFLPGYTLIMALFPSRGELDERDDTIFRLALAIILSLVISGGVFSFMALMPGRPLTATNMAGSLVAITAGLFLMGYLRGAYPWLGREAPITVSLSLSRADQPLHDELEAKRKVLDRQIASARRRYDRDPSDRLSDRIKRLEIERDLVVREMELLEKPEELRALHLRAQALVRRWGRLNRLEAA
ncbi:MAG TPA: DUF1616 domain-containing protein, partial [Thermoplasmata archaeon]|nr:DUF1616 domain-containing protein [Thermoplasmata archaeon]